MRICLIGNVKKRYYSDLKTFCTHNKYSFTFMRSKDLYIEWENSNEIKIEHRYKDFLDFDIYFIHSEAFSKFSSTDVIEDYLENAGKKVISNNLTYLNYMNLVKKLLKQNITFHPFSVAHSLKAARDLLIEYKHPVNMIINYSKKEYSEDWTESYDILRTYKPIDTVIISTEILSQPIFQVYFVGNTIKKVLKKETYYQKKLKKYKVKLLKQSSYKQYEKFFKQVIKLTGINFGLIEFFDDGNNVSVIDIKSFPKYGKLLKLSKMNFAHEIYHENLN